MASKKKITIWGGLFLGTLLLALVLAQYPAEWAGILLVLLGLVIGVMPISKKERPYFLLVAIALAVIGTPAVVAGMPGAGVFVSGFLKNLFTAFAPASIVVAILLGYDIAKHKER